MNYGMHRWEIKRVILESLERNPDLKYYINNDYIFELVDCLVDGISQAIEENTNEVMDQITGSVRRHL